MPSLNDTLLVISKGLETLEITLGERPAMFGICFISVQKMIRPLRKLSLHLKWEMVREFVSELKVNGRENAFNL